MRSSFLVMVLSTLTTLRAYLAPVMGLEEVFQTRFIVWELPIELLNGESKWFHGYSLALPSTIVKGIVALHPEYYG